MRCVVNLWIRAVVRRHKVVVHRIVPSPESRDPIKLVAVGLVEPSDRRLHADVPEGVSEQRLYADEDFGDRQRQTPVVVDWVEANVAMAADVRVEDFCNETHNRWSHWVTKENIYKLHKI